MSFAGNDRFELRRELGRGGMGVVWEAFDRERGEPVALKLLQRKDEQTILRLKQEFRTLSEVAHPRLVSMYELLGDGDDWFFTMELVQDGRDFLTHIRGQQAPLIGADPVIAGILAAGEQTIAEDAVATQALDSATLELAPDPELPMCADAGMASENSRADLDSVPVAWPPERLARVIDSFRQLAEGVQALHALGKLHRDLKPGNVMVRGDGRVAILDFGLVQERRRKRVRTSSSAGALARSGEASSVSWSEQVIAGTIPYMAPEQAAAEPLTEASDWYAVGVMLYETLTGELPFSGAGKEILRAKQRAEAPDVAGRCAGLPPKLQTLCMALLRRRPEQRPSGREVVALLCELAGRRPEAEDAEVLAAEALLRHETEFVGREPLLALLRDGFEQSRTGVVAADLHGRSGYGKSALARHFLEELEATCEEPLLILRGRCYEQESVPYKTVDGIVDELALWLSHLSEAEQSELVPPESPALAKIAPVFRRVPVISAAVKAAVPLAVDVGELRQRGFQVFGDLLARLGERYRLVLWIDDLQWGDVDGVSMLRSALQHVDTHLLLLTTSREEYAPTSAALKAMREAEQAGMAVVDVAVGPLTEEESVQLLRALLPEREVGELAAIIGQAAGNPYFIEELARHVRAGHTLPRAGAGSGLDEILWRRITRLGPAELDVLETIAISGQPIRLLYAQSAAGHRNLPPSAMTTLRMHHLVRSNGPGLFNEIETYHDRIRETVLARLPAERKRARHLSLAERLEASGEASPDTLAVHFESGDRPEKAGLCYELAAQESAHALAFERAEGFFGKARALVSEPGAKARIVEQTVHLYTDLARFKEAYALGRESLAGMGLRLPQKFFPPELVLDFARNWLLMRGRTIPGLADHPAATDAGHIARMQLLATIGKAAYQIKPQLCIAILLKMVNQCLKRGHVRDSAIGYIAVGSIFQGGILGRYETGHQFGLLSLELVERYKAERIRAEVQFVVGYFGTSWRRPSREAERLFQSAREAGVATGDLFHFGMASCATAMSQWMRGAPLGELAAVAGEYEEEMARYRLREPACALQAVSAAVRRLRDGDDSAPTPTGVALEEFGSRHVAHYELLLEMQLRYLSGDFEGACATARRSATFLADSKGMLHGPEHFFWLALASLGWAKRGLKPRAPALASGRSASKRFARWSSGVEENFLCRQLLLEGEVLCVAGQQADGMKRFEAAYQAALRFAQPHMAGLSRQLAAEAAVGTEFAGRRQELLYDSATQYRAWGAAAYADRLMAGQAMP